MKHAVVRIVVMLAVAWSIPGGDFVEAKSSPRSFTEQAFEAVCRLVGDNGSSATSFLVAHKTDSSSLTLLVTARHVLDGMAGDSATVFVRRFLPRDSFNVYAYHFALRNHGHPLYRTHPDTSVDIAAIELPFPSGADIRLVSRDFIASADDFRTYNIQAGDELFYLGYPFGAASPAGDLPLLRSGVVATYPVRAERPFLLDGAVYDGNSGGPVYFDPRTSRNNRGTAGHRPKLVGVLTTVRIQETRAGVTDSTTIRRYLNLGGVVSSVRLLELLDTMFGRPDTTSRP